MSAVYSNPAVEPPANLSSLPHDLLLLICDQLQVQYTHTYPDTWAGDHKETFRRLGYLDREHLRPLLTVNKSLRAAALERYFTTVRLARTDLSPSRPKSRNLLAVRRAIARIAPDQLTPYILAGLPTPAVEYWAPLLGIQNSDGPLPDIVHFNPSTGLPTGHHDSDALIEDSNSEWGPETNVLHPNNMDRLAGLQDSAFNNTVRRAAVHWEIFAQVVDGEAGKYNLDRPQIRNALQYVCSVLSKFSGLEELIVRTEFQDEPKDDEVKFWETFFLGLNTPKLKKLRLTERISCDRNALLASSEAATLRAQLTHLQLDYSLGGIWDNQENYYDFLNTMPRLTSLTLASHNEGWRLLSLDGVKIPSLRHFFIDTRRSHFQFKTKGHGLAAFISRHADQLGTVQLHNVVIEHVEGEERMIYEQPDSKYADEEYGRFVEPSTGTWCDILTALLECPKLTRLQLSRCRYRDTGFDHGDLNWQDLRTYKHWSLGDNPELKHHVARNSYGGIITPYTMDIHALADLLRAYKARRGNYKSGLSELRCYSNKSEAPREYETDSECETDRDSDLDDGDDAPSESDPNEYIKANWCTLPSKDHTLIWPDVVYDPEFFETLVSVDDVKDGAKPGSRFNIGSGTDGRSELVEAMEGINMEG